MSDSNKSTEPEKKSNFWTEYAKLRRIFRLFPLTFSIIRPQLKSIALAYGLSLLVTWLGMLEPKYVGTIVDIVTRSKDAEDLKGLVVQMIIFSTILRLSTRVSDRVSNQANIHFKNNAKVEVYRTLLGHNMPFFDKISTAEATDAISRGVDILQYLYFTQIKSVLETTFTFVGSLGFMYSISPKLTCIVLFVTPAKLFLTYVSLKKRSNYYENLEKLWKESMSLPTQAIENISLVKSFSTEHKECKELADIQKTMATLEENSNGGFWNLNLLIDLVENALNAVLIWFGGIMAFQGLLTPGEISTFNLYLLNFNNAFTNTTHSIKWLHDSLMRSERLLKVLEAGSNEKVHKSKGLVKTHLKGCVDIKNLSFSYPSKPEVEVLSNVNLQINAGEAVAFVGASGSGKTTMLSLIQNLYTPTQGEIIVDGEKVEDYDVAWLHQRMGYVAQEPVLLDRTVEQNVAYGLESHTLEQIEKALEMSNSKFILNKEKFPDGLNTNIGSEGIKFSGGQKQRLAIARAFVKDPKILILDEPTSALDGESESKVQKAIDELTGLGDRTVIVVAHRLSTIINCSKIVVFEEGKIVEQGTHRELIEKNGVYKKLFEFQMNNMKKL